MFKVQQRVGVLLVERSNGCTFSILLKSLNVVV